MNADTEDPTVPRFEIDAHQESALRQLEQARFTGSPVALRNAKQQVITAHLSYAAALARHYHDRGLDPEDLRQLAYLGLVKAVHRWDPRISIHFLAFAGPTIGGEIRRHLRDQFHAVRIPRPLQDLHWETLALQVDLQQLHGREPTDTELAAAAGVDVARIRAQRAAFAHCRAASLEQPALRNVVEQVTSSRAAAELQHVEDQMLVAQAMCTLTGRERRIVELRYYGDGLSQDDIADAIGVSQMQISRLLRAIARKLRAALAEPDDHPDYLPDWAQLAG